MAAHWAQAEVHVFVSDTNGTAWIHYQCNAGEVVRAFALDVSVDRGEIVGVSNFFRGPGTSSATGYGIFPASFRDQFHDSAGTNINWASAAYTPVANPQDYPADTLPGLGSTGVTLEFGGLWDLAAPAATPAATGTLCSLRLSESAIVSERNNGIRGGIVSAVQGQQILASFSSAPVGPIVTSVASQADSVTIRFNGGELQESQNVTGPWADTGDSSGNRTEPLSPNQPRFYRVRATY